MLHVRAQIHCGGTARANGGEWRAALLPSVPGYVLRTLFYRGRQQRRRETMACWCGIR
jgi:hypothetical protein